MSDITSKDHIGRHCVLRDAVGRVVQEGDRLTDFRGGVWLAAGGTAPHKPSSTGRIWVNKPGQPLTEFFPSVFDCAWTPG